LGYSSGSPVLLSTAEIETGNYKVIKKKARSKARSNFSESPPTPYIQTASYFLGGGELDTCVELLQELS
jgi:hypothetical protein